MMAYKVRWTNSGETGITFHHKDEALRFVRKQLEISEWVEIFKSEVM